MTKESTTKDKPKSLEWKSVDEVVGRAIEFEERSKPKHETYTTLYKKLEKAYNRTFDISKIDMDDDKSTPSIYLSALGRIQIEIFKKSIVFPVPEITATSRKNPGTGAKNSEKAMEIASIARGLIKWAVREALVESIFNRAKEFWVAFGDVFLQFFVRKGKKRNMIGLEMRQGKDVILDPDGKLVDTGYPGDEIQAKYDRNILTKEQVISMFGKEVLKYATVGSHFKDTSKEKGESPGAEYYELTEGMNKATEEEVSMLGGNAFPVMRFAKDDSFDKAFTKEYGGKALTDLKASEKLAYENKYRYYDSLGEPYINTSQLHCYYDDNNPTNFGIQLKVYSLQYLQELTENAKADSFRREIDNITYVTGIRPSTFRNNFQEYKAKKKSDLGEVMVMPQAISGVKPEMKVLEWPTLNPLSAQQMADGISNLARNTVGVDPNRLEIQKNEGLGLREQLQEEKVEAVSDVVDGTLLAFIRMFERLLNFIIVHKGLNLTDVFIDFEKVTNRPSGEGTFINKKARISIVDAAKRLEDTNWDIHVSITKDSLIKKSNAILLERILSFMERVDPNAFPDLYKKLILTLNELLPTNITAEDVVPQAEAKPLGGASQFQTGGAGGGGVAGTSGQVAPEQGGQPAPQGAQNLL